MQLDDKMHEQFPEDLNVIEIQVSKQPQTDLTWWKEL